MKRKKRPYLLLEVIISMILVSLFLFPILSPHVYILRAQQKAIETMQNDHVANRLYVHILRELYENRIPISALLEEQTLTIQDATLRDLGFESFAKNYQIAYRFEEEKHKPKDDPYQHYLFNLFLILKQKPSSKETTYHFSFFLIRDLQEKGESNEE